MARSKRGKGKRRQNHHQHQPKEPDKDFPASNNTSDIASRRAGEVTYKVITPKCSTEQTQIVSDVPQPTNSPSSAPTSNQTWLPGSVRASDSGAPAGSNYDGFEALLEGLTGSDLQTATSIVQALRTPEDLSRLRCLAVTHGFVNNRIRAVVWPRLLGLSPPGAGGLKLGQLSSLPSSQANHRSDEPLCTRPGEAQQQQQPLHQAFALPTSARQASITPLVAADPEALLQRVQPSGDVEEPPLSLGLHGTCTCSAPQTPKAGCFRDEAQLEVAAAEAEAEAELAGEKQPSLDVAARHQDGRAVSREFGEVMLGVLCGGPEPSDSHGATSPGFLVSGFADAGAVRNADAAGNCCAACGGALPSAPGSVSRVIDIGCHENTRACANQDPDPDADFDANLDEGPGSRNLLNPWDSPKDDRHQYYKPSGGDGDWDGDWLQYLRWSQEPHRDSTVVEVDVARSLWAFTRDLSDQQRDARRQQLKRLLNAVVAAHEGDVFYYQGLHDVASVLLMSMPGCPPGLHQSTCLAHQSTYPPAHCSSLPGLMDVDIAAPSIALVTSSSSRFNAAAAAANGELRAFALLRRLVTTHLRDATRPSLEPVVQLLGLMPYLVRATDPALASHMADRGLQPFFALSWFITWWAHELDDLSQAARLYDFFLASHPLMPLYVGAVAMRSQRSGLLACEDMPELHSALTNLKLVVANDGGSNGGEGDGRRRSRGSGGSGRLSAAGMTEMMPLKELLRQAEQLWRARPPQTLVPLSMSREPQQPRLRKRRGRSGAGKGDGKTVVTLTACVAHAAKMEGQPALWSVPRTAPADWPDSVGGDGQPSGIGHILSRANNVLGGRSRAALLSTALLAGVYVAAAVAIGYATFSRTTGGQQ